MRRTLEEQRKTVATTLTLAIVDAGKSQKEVAEHCGVSKAAVSNWCTGLKKPKTETVSDLSAWLGVPIEYLLGTGVFDAWEDIAADKAGFVSAAMAALDDEDPAEYLRLFYDINPNRVHEARLANFTQFISENFTAIKKTETGWYLTPRTLKTKPTPDTESGQIGPNKQALLDAVKDCDEETARIILDVIRSVKQLNGG